MTTIRERIIQRIDRKIATLKIARRRLSRLLLSDEKLNIKITKLTNVRNKLIIKKVEDETQTQTR